MEAAYAATGRKRVLYSIARRESLSERGRGTRKWSKVEKASKREPAGTPLILDPRWRYTRWSKFRKGERESERGEREGEREGEWL